MKLFSIICICLNALPSIEAQLLPAEYTIEGFNPVSVNGSRIYGGCSSGTFNGETTTCSDPASSVLFDGHIPTLTGLDGNMWASDLLALQFSSDNDSTIALDFSGCENVETLVVTLFNCPDWGIGTNTITLIESAESDDKPSNDNPENECDSLVNVTLTRTTALPVLLLEIDRRNRNFVYLAEVTASSSNSTTCIPTGISTTADSTSTRTDSSSTTADSTTEAATIRLLPFILTAVITAIIVALLVTIIFVLVLIAVCKCCLEPIQKQAADTEAKPVEGQSYSRNETETLEENIPMTETQVQIEQEVEGGGYVHLEPHKGRAPLVTERKEGQDEDRLREQEDVAAGTTQPQGKSDCHIETNTEQSKQNLSENDPTTSDTPTDKDGYVKMDANKGKSVVNLPHTVRPDSRGYAVPRGDVTQSPAREQDGNQMDSATVTDCPNRSGLREDTPQGYIKMDGDNDAPAATEKPGYDKVRRGPVHVSGGERDSYIIMDGNKGVSVVNLEPQDQPSEEQGVANASAGVRESGYMKMDGNRGASTLTQDGSRGYAEVNRSTVVGIATDKPARGRRYHQVGGQTATVPHDPSRRESSGYAEVMRKSISEVLLETDETKPHDYAKVGEHAAANASAPDRKDRSGYTVVDRSKLATVSETDYNTARERPKTSPEPHHEDSKGYTVVERSKAPTPTGEPERLYDKVGAHTTTPPTPCRRDSAGYTIVDKSRLKKEAEQPHEYDMVQSNSKAPAQHRPEHRLLPQEQTPTSGQQKFVTTPVYTEPGKEGGPLSFSQTTM